MLGGGKDPHIHQLYIHRGTSRTGAPGIGLAALPSGHPRTSHVPMLEDTLSRIKKTSHTYISLSLSLSVSLLVWGFARFPTEEAPL